MKKSIVTGLVALLIGAGLMQAQKPKSQKEVDALMAIQNAPDPDARLAAIENLLTKFADTEFKVAVLQMAAQLAQQKNDFEKMIIYCDRTLEADPKNYTCMLMEANGIAGRTREFDLDREEKLAKVEKLAKDGMALAKDAPKPNPGIPDDQWVLIRKDLVAQGHESLGLSALARKKYDDAITEFKTAVDTAGQVDPATLVRLGAAYNGAGKPDAAIAVLDRAAAMPEAAPAVKQFAAQEKAKSMKLKADADKK